MHKNYRGKDKKAEDQELLTKAVSEASKLTKKSKDEYQYWLEKQLNYVSASAKPFYNKINFPLSIVTFNNNL